MITTTPDYVLTVRAVARLVGEWNRASTSKVIASELTCEEVEPLAAVFLAAGDKDSATAWIAEHVATSSECRGHDEEPLMSTTTVVDTPTVVHALTCTRCGSNGVQPAVREWVNCTNCKHGMSLSEAMTCDCDGYDCVPRPTDHHAPEPGEAYTYPLCDYAYATARSLGAGWEADSCHLGAWGLILSLDGRVALRLYVDGTGDTGDLMLQDRHTGAEYVVPGECTPAGGAASTPDEMREWGNALALFVLALGL
ncbi:hypothetical protein ACH4Y0_02620 [Streptomyces sp. NPDC020707]|uniref:hypothetical protein n=1 Tax=Streptomyces sp. NPDC020707 TaxID=3365084 RepID=UPI0037B8598A